MPDDQPPVIEAIAAEDTICVDWTFTIGTWFLAYDDPKIGAALNANNENNVTKETAEKIITPPPDSSHD